jgi:hypothetical protein
LSETADGEWLSFHLFYHGDRDRVVTGYVRPAVASLWAAGHIARFYFVRYGLGGPHVRLRALARPGHALAVEEALTSAASAFLSRWASPMPLDEESIRKENQALLASDGGEEEDDDVYPDNTFRRFPLRFEVARYGGPELLGPTLDLFNLSSLHVLRFLDLHGGKPPAQRLAAAFGLLARQVCGLARTEEELLALLEYPGRAWAPLAPLATRADRAFDERSASFRSLFRAAVQSLSSPAAECEGARRLALEIGAAPDAHQRRIASSHLHMTANRLGLRNTDEVYLARLLWRTVADLAGTGAELRDRLAALHAAPPELGWSELVSREMENLLAGIVDSGDNPLHPGRLAAQCTGEPSL